MLKPRLAALLLALSSSLAGCAPRVIQIHPAAAETDRPGSMVVTGQATLQVSPDCADITITITTDDLRPGTAVATLEARKAALVAALKAAGVKGPDLTLSSVQLEPLYERNPDGWAQPKVRTYRAQMVVTATTREFGAVGDLMNAAAGAGATSMATAFRRSDLPELKKQVRDQALAAARAKATQTAAALGIRLGRIVSVAENQGGSMWSSAYFPQVANAMETRGDGGGELGGALQPLTLDVTIGYELPRS